MPDPGIAQIADKLTDEQRDGLLRSRLMVSGGVRLPWGPEPFGSLSALGLARYGGYLTQLGIDVKHHIRRHGQHPTPSSQDTDQ